MASLSRGNELDDPARPDARPQAGKGSGDTRTTTPRTRAPSAHGSLHLLGVVLAAGGVSRWQAVAADSAAAVPSAAPSVPSFQSAACLAGLSRILRLLMSNLISSYILEPVARHARRFSEARASSASHGDLSAAIPGDSRPSRAAAGGSAAARPAAPPRLATTSLSVRDASAVADDDQAVAAAAVAAPSPAAPIDGSDLAAAATPESTEDPPRSTAAAAFGHALLTQSPTRTTAPSSAATPRNLEDERSSNPAYGLPAPFRPADGSPDSSRLPRGSASTIDQSRRDNTRALTYPPAPGIAMSESLPADDGMRQLRQRIHEIRELGVSSDEKARRMHGLMTEKYNASQGNITRPRSPSSVISQDRPFTPSSTLSDLHLSSPNSVYSAFDSDNPYNLAPEDLKPTFCPPCEHADVSGDGAAMDEDEDEEPVFGCKHYKRNVKIQCFDCHRWYTCRHCHDERESHHLNRKRTRNMFCMMCATPQPAAEFCRSCQVRTAWYYCEICKLWDNDSTKSIYHCPDCGICRRGEGLGKDFIHCKRCNVCISIKYADDHRCIERATDADCPICKDYMFTSSTDVVSMKCGHYMHRDCYNAYMQSDYKCPMCKKSAVNMELQWRKLRDAIESQPMPPQFADTRVVIHCNDCCVKSTSGYHWIGNQCAHCESFNTTELRLMVGNEPEQDPVSPTDENGTPSSPRSCLAPSSNVIERRSSGSYFLLAEREEREARERDAAAAGRPRSADGSTFSPFEMLQRVRSLSPVRRFLGGSDEEMEDAAEDYEDDSDDSMDEDEELEEDEEIDDAEEDELNMFHGLELIGHR